MLDRFSVLVQGLDHPEGVTWGPDGRIYAGGEAGQIYRATIDGVAEQIGTTRGFVLGLALDKAGRVYACDVYHHKVIRFDSRTGGAEVYSAGTPSEPMNVPNYLAFDDAGNLYVTSSGNWGEDDGKIFRISLEGETSVWTREPSAAPNGCCLNAAGDALYVVESTRPRVSRIPILDDGSAGPLEVIVELPDSTPDGIAFDVGDSFYVSCYSPNRIYYVSPSCDVEVLADDPSGTLLSAPTNVVFSGENLDRLVVANVSRFHLLVTEADVPGLPLRYPEIPCEAPPPTPYSHRF